MTGVNGQLRLLLPVQPTVLKNAPVREKVATLQKKEPLKTITNMANQLQLLLQVMVSSTPKKNALHKIVAQRD